MKVTRIRKHKHTTEITFVVTVKEAGELAHFLGCNQPHLGPCEFPELKDAGRLLANQLDREGVIYAW
jgi:hypothetical protein